MDILLELSNMKYTLSFNPFGMFCTTCFSVSRMEANSEVYCYQTKSKGKKAYKPYNPQPDQVITIHRYYTSLKRDKSIFRYLTDVDLYFLLF
jgi:hypothetical protein